MDADLGRSDIEPPGDARRIGRLGRVLVVGAVAMTVIGLVLVERVSDTYEDGLAVTMESALLVSDAVVPVGELADDLQEVTVTLGVGLEGVRELLATTQQVLDDIGVASSTNLAEAATAAADISDRLADVIEAIERFIPGDTQSLAEELRSFADGLEPLADQLVALGDQLVRAAGQLDAADASLAGLIDQTNALSVDIGALSPTLDTLAATADDLHVRAQAAATRLDLDRWLLRLLVILGGVVVATIGIAIERFGRVLGDRRTVMT